MAWWILLRRPLAALLSGTVLAAAFPPIGASVLAPLGVTLLTLACWRARPWVGAACGFLAGSVFYLILLSWLQVIGTDAWILLSLGWSLWSALLGLGTALTTRLRWWPVAVAAVWVLSEALRDRMPWGGFPWGRLAFSQPDSPLTPLAAILGAPGVTFAVALVGTLLAGVALAARAGRVRAAGLALLAAVAVAGAGLLVPLPVTGQGTPSSATIAVVQGNVPEVGLDFNARRRAVLENHVTETIRLSQRVARGEVPAPQAVIWPENSSDVNPFSDQLAAARIAAAAAAIQAPILVGAVIDAPGSGDQLWNVGLVWQPGSGPSDSYAKQHPVPFGEYLPGRSLLGGLVDRFKRIPRDFVGGDEPGVLQVGPARIGDVICFEIAYDDIVRNVVRSGGRVLVVQTNNATYGGTSQPAQQVAMSRLRAVEHGRGVLVAATSGITAVLAADGTVVDQLPESRPGTIVTQVPLRDTLSIADRLGVWPELVLATVGVLGCILGGVVGWRRRAGQRIGSST